jgi:hypothetical protein
MDTAQVQFSILIPEALNPLPTPEAVDDAPSDHVEYAQPSTVEPIAKLNVM